MELKPTNVANMNPFLHGHISVEQNIWIGSTFSSYLPLKNMTSYS